VVWFLLVPVVLYFGIASMSQLVEPVDGQENETSDA